MNSESSSLKPAATTMQAAELDAMRRMLIASHDTFSLSFAVCNSPLLRDYLIGSLRSSHPGIEVISLPKDAADPYGFVESSLKSKELDALFLTDLEKQVPGEEANQPTLQSLNASRELWAKRFKCPVIFWLPEYAIALLTQHARDFYRYRSHQFEFVSEFASVPAGIMDHLVGRVVAAPNLSKDEKYFRIAELEQRLGEVVDLPRDELVVHYLGWLNELGALYFSLGQLSVAKEHWERMAALAEVHKLEHPRAVAYANMGTISTVVGDLVGASRLHQKSLRAFEAMELRESVAETLQNLGIIERERGNLEAAESCFRSALAIHIELESPRGVASATVNLANVMEDMNNLDGARSFNQKALEIFKGIEQPDGMAACYDNLSRIAVLQGNLDKATEYNQKAFEIAEMLGDLSIIATAYANRGLISGLTNKAEEAMLDWQKALKIFTQTNNTRKAEVMRRLIETQGLELKSPTSPVDLPAAIPRNGGDGS